MYFFSKKKIVFGRRKRIKHLRPARGQLNCLNDFYSIWYIPLRRLAVADWQVDVRIEIVEQPNENDFNAELNLRLLLLRKLILIFLV